MNMRSSRLFTIYALITLLYASHIHTSDILTSMLETNTGASMLIFAGLKALKKTAKANELEEAKSELRRAEKGAFTYGVINLLLGTLNPKHTTLQPLDATADVAAFTSTYWVVRKIARQVIDSELATLICLALRIDYIPESYQKLFKQVSLGAITHLIHQWTKQVGGLA